MNAKVKEMIPDGFDKDRWEWDGDELTLYIKGEPFSKQEFFVDSPTYAAMSNIENYLEQLDNQHEISSANSTTYR